MIAWFTGPSLLAGAEFVIKITLVFLVGAALVALFHRRSAAVRHFVWTLTLLAAVALPLVASLAPRFELPLMPRLDFSSVRWPASSVVEPTPSVAAPERAAEVRVAPVAASSVDVARPYRTTAPSPLVLIWLAGFGAVILRCVLGHLGLLRLVRRATPVADGEWLTLLDEVMARSGVQRPVRLLRSTAVGAPMTWGFRRPIVVLPADSGAWSAERRRVVLLHELAHVARHDYLVQLLANVACAFYWFHPAAWMAARRLRNESERACDDHALVCGLPAAEYASHLLSLACSARAPRLSGAMAIGMARPSTLEGRLLSVLDESIIRRAISRRWRAAGAVALGLVLLPLAAITPVARAAAKEEIAEPSLERSVDASPGEQLNLDLETGGEVSVRGWDEPRVHVVTRLGGRDAKDVRVEISRQGDGVLVRSFFARARGSQSTSNEFEIRVPRRFDLRLSSAGGDLNMADVEGTFEGKTGGGEITLENLNGEARLSTGGGDIHVSDCDLQGSVSTGGGMVKLSRVRGGLRGSSGSGPVLYGELAGADEPTADLSRLEVDRSRKRIVSADRVGVLHIRKAGGDVDLDEAPEGAVISTGGGTVTVGRAAGLVEAKTGGGDIEIGPVAGSVRAGTGGGNIHVTLVDADGERQTVELTSGNGRMIVELPADFDGTFELETAYTERHGATRIDSAWDLKREATTQWDGREGTPRRYVRARGTVGSGRGHVRIKTVNGDIEVRRR